MRFVWWFAAFVALPEAAAAHTPTAGIGGFYLGLSHPLLVPGVLLALLSLGLVVGQRGDAAFVPAWPAFASGAVAGVALTLVAGFLIEPNVPLLVLATVYGLFAASALPLPRSGAMAGAAAAGVLIGIAAAPDPGPLRATVITAGGALISAHLLFLFVVGVAMRVHETFTRAWVAVALRIAGSWIAAVAALMAALSAVPQGTALTLASPVGSVVGAS